MIDPQTQLLQNPFVLLLLLLLLVLTFPLGQARELRRNRISRLIPSLRFFRIALVAALLAGALLLLGVENPLISWIQLIINLGFYIALVEVAVDLVWQLISWTSHDRTAAPRILKDLTFVTAAFIVITAVLYHRGTLNTIGTAAVLSVLAFVVGPGSATQLQNISSALTVQVERQFLVGEWVEIDGQQGRVDNVSWNSTYLYDDINDRYVVFPNAMIDKAKIVNYSRPSPTDFGVEISVGLPYEMSPAEALALLEGAVWHHHQIPEPDRARAFLRGFGASSIDYTLHFFIPDFLLRYEVSTEVSMRIWYAVRRAGYSIPFPVVDLRTPRSSRDLLVAEQRELRQRNFELLRAIDLFEPLEDADLQAIVCEDQRIDFAPGEVIVRRGDVGGSMFVIMDGCCSVLVSDGSSEGREVELSRLSKGDVFGEIAALTNAPRTATIRAVGHVSVQEISQKQIQSVFLKNQKTMEELAKIMTAREAGRRQFSPSEQQTFQSGLLERMKGALGRLFS